MWVADICRGGLALQRDGSPALGYHHAATPEQLAQLYEALLHTVGQISFLAGFCYTQLADTYQEANGLLYADRTPKIPLETIRDATLPTRHAGTLAPAELLDPHAGT